MKKTSRSITHVKSSRRTLRLAKEAIRVLRPADLAAVAAGCDTTSFATERQTGISAHC